jgi:hypothetical protein
MIDMETSMKRNLLLVMTGAILGCVATFGQGFALKAPIAQKPALLTSVGQSADIEMVKVLLERAALPHTMDPQVKPANLAAAGAKTLIMVVGGSTKGLGAAGVSADAEIERGKNLIAAAKRLGMTLIGLHVGGSSRRGELSDKFIQATIPSCDYVIVVTEGNKDGFFEKLCGTSIPLDQVERISKAVDPLQKAFK